MQLITDTWKMFLKLVIKKKYGVIINDIVLGAGNRYIWQMH